MSFRTPMDDPDAVYTIHPRSAPSSFQREMNRTRCIDALHSYVIEYVDYDHRLARQIADMVVNFLDEQLAGTPQAQPDGYAA